MSVTLYSHGACEEVTGSKHFLSINGKETVQIDCGAFQGKRAEADKKNREWNYDAKSVDSVLLTHAHYDHCGLLPLLSKKGFQGNVYATSATRDLANLIMMDSAHIQAMDAKFMKEKAEKKGEKFDWTPMYDESDVVKLLQQFVTLSYDRVMPVSPSVSMKMLDAGHILGSAVVYTEIKTGADTLRVGFSGDLGRKNRPILNDPVPMPEVDWLVLESTYGHRKHDPMENALALLEEAVGETLDKNGRIVIPAFSVERTQELVYYFHQLVESGRIPDVPIYVDSPMSVNATAIFKVHQECYDKETSDAFTVHHENPFGWENLRYITAANESKELNEKPGPIIIISADGMCEAGRVQHHLIHTITDPRNLVLVVGFMAADTLGRRIKEQQKEVKIFGDRYPLRAKVATINAFSGHADYEETGAWVRATQDPKRLKGIYLVHGEPDAQAGMKTHLESLGYGNIKIAKYGERYELG